MTKQYGALMPQDKLLLKKAAKYCCHECGKRKNPEELQIHHINHNQGDNSTKGDISSWIITPAKGDACQTATAIFKDGTSLQSNGADFTVFIPSKPPKVYMHKEWLPILYEKIAPLVERKANGRGGRRIGAGRKADKNTVKRTPRTIRMTDTEYCKVKVFLQNLRGENAAKEETEI